MFDAAAALNMNKAHERVERLEDQHRLDITNKSRTSVMPWRGQFSPQLVEYLLEKFAPEGCLVVDPFCGSGTVLYEAASRGMDSYAVDLNPAAVCLAEFALISNMSSRDRLSLTDKLRKFSATLIASSKGELQAEICADQAVRHLYEHFQSGPEHISARVLLLTAFADLKCSSPKRILRALRSLEVAISSAPVGDVSISVEIGDARDLGLESGRAGYIITSPPYINVFNYHQNYRPIVEQLGYEPLPIARAEIGANRKFRQNRYMTVVQYCIDMALFFKEAHRVLMQNGLMTIVLGRESNVRGVSFKNGELVGAILGDGLGWPVKTWTERKFLNRFGETIFEDVITFSRPDSMTSSVADIGRSVGVEALRLAEGYAPPERQREIADAIASSSKITWSPYVLKTGRH